MLKFSIRELALLTTIVALVLGWCVDHLRLSRLAEADDNLFQLVAEMNSRGMGIIRDPTSGKYVFPGFPGPHRSRIDGGIPEPFEAGQPLPPNSKEVVTDSLAPSASLPPGYVRQAK